MLADLRFNKGAAVNVRAFAYRPTNTRPAGVSTKLINKKQSRAEAKLV